MTSGEKKSKKIGILTFHRALSYGAVLQAYALQNFLFANHIENEIIDYRCQEMIDRYQKLFRKTRGNKLKGFAWNLYTAPDIMRSKRLINEFVDSHLKMSYPYNGSSVVSVGSKYSKFLCGSDQVWSPTCVGFDPVYFLPFAKPEQKYSYAASIAVKEIPEEIRQEFADRIRDFSGYSLREGSGKSIVEKLTRKQAQVHIDPTLLLEKNDWDKLASDKKQTEPYILLFTVLKPEKLVDYALELSRKTGLKILYLNNKSPKKVKGITYINPIKPNEFIELIKKAEYVCTNSFHGSAFSIIYRKNFVVETEIKERKNIRSQELLTALGLEERLLSKENIPDINAKSHWDNAEKILSEEREKARSYLLALKN